MTNFSAGTKWDNGLVGDTGDRVGPSSLVRWPFAVPELARRHVAADGPDAAATRRSVAVVFATLRALLGVGIGEHLGVAGRRPGPSSR